MMDIGSHSYTESDNHTDDVISMLDRIPAYMENRYGLIHTHHNMSAFFSSTDVQELHDNVHLYSYYLSLIVNFDGKWCAKIANLIDVNSSSYTITEEDEDDVTVEIPSKKVMITFDLDIEFEQAEAYDDVVELRIAEIQERKRKAEEEKKKKSLLNNPYQTNMFKNTDSYYSHSSLNAYNDWHNQYTNLYKSDETDKKGGLTEDDEIEWFISCLIYLDKYANEPLHDALSDLKDHESDSYFDAYVDQLNDNALEYAVDHFGVEAYEGVCSTLKIRDALEDAKEQLNKNNEYSL
jgi:phage pi2 protein 07